MLSVAQLMDLLVLCIACLAVFVNCLVKQFAMCLGVVAIVLLNIMEVYSVGGGSLLDRTCRVVPKNVHVVPVIPVFIKVFLH